MSSALTLALGKAGNFAFVEFPALLSARARALGKEITKNKIKKYLPSADLAGHSAKKLLKKYLPSASPAGHSAKKF